MVLAEALVTTAGADVIVLPATADELSMRIARAQFGAGSAVRGELLDLDGLVLDLATYEATLDGRSLALTHMEFELCGSSRCTRAAPTRAPRCLERVWGYGFSGETRTVDVHVRRVRQKSGPPRPSGSRRCGRSATRSRGSPASLYAGPL